MRSRFFIVTKYITVSTIFDKNSMFSTFSYRKSHISLCYNVVTKNQEAHSGD